MTFPTDDEGARRAQMAAKARGAVGEKLSEIWWAFMLRGILAALLAWSRSSGRPPALAFSCAWLASFSADGVTALAVLLRGGDRGSGLSRHHQPRDRRGIAFPARDVRPCRVHASWGLGAGDGVGLPVGRPSNGCTGPRAQRGTHPRQRDFTRWPGANPLAGHGRGRPGMGSRGCRADYCRPSDLGGAPIEASR